MKTVRRAWPILIIRLAVLVLSTVLLATGLTLSSSAPGTEKTNAGTGKINKGKASKGKRTQDPQFPLPTPTPVTGPAPASLPTPEPAKGLADLRAAQSISGTQASSGPMDPTSGTLTGRMFSSVPPNPVNLTTQGTVDWAHWGNGGPTVFNHKSNVSSQISNYTVIGTSQIFWLADNPTGHSWSDGTPTPTATNVRTGVFAIEVGNGFQFTVPADANLKTLRINLGLWRARGRFEASLSDGSAPTYVDTSLVNTGGTSNGTYTISFAAASAGQTLTIKYTCQTSFFAGSGNVTLEAATLVNGGDPDLLPNISISNPTGGATFNAGDSVSLTANAFDLDGSISNVKFYVDGFLLGTGTATGTNQYGLTWNGAFAGPHIITAVATDNEGAMATSEPVNVTVFPAIGGTLTGKLHWPSTTPVNLTTEGELDWAHWGNGGAQVFDHKAGVPQQISNVTIIGNVSPAWLADNPTPFSWTNGTPNASASNNRTGIFVGSAGNGFEITVPADVNFKTVRIFTGYWYSQTKLEASLSDGSAPTFVETSLGGTGAVQNGIYALSYRAASDGETLRIRYTVLTDYNPPFGNVALEAVTLSNGGPPTVSIASPGDGAIVSAGQTTSITAAVSDPSGISKVEFFQNGSLLGERTTSPYSINWAPPGGVYSLHAVATNNKGITAASTPIGVTSNSAPVVSAGYNQTVFLPGTATLFGTVTDDGQPGGGTLALSWSKVSGPGTVSFGSPSSALTTATFSGEGDYVLRLTANDGGASIFGDVVIGVRSAVTMPLTTTADAHVRDGSSAATNFGTATTIEVQTGASGSNRDAYFKFDITNAGVINNAKLRIYAATSAAGSLETSVYPVSNTTWSETAINWNIRPTLGSPVLSSVTVNGTTFAWYELDVTNYLISEKNAGRNVVTLALHNASSSTINIKINSKEAASNKPELSVSTSEASFVMSQTPGTVRNNLSAFVGMKFTVGLSPVLVTSLGRVFVSGNTGTHTVKLVNAATGTDIAGGSVSLNLSAGTASNGFKYAPLAAPLTLAANTAYYLVSQETNGGDQWYDSNTVVSTTAIASVNNAIQRPNNTWQAAGSTNNSFGPVNFKYIAAASTTTVTYHLHVEASPTQPPPVFKISTAGPDAAATGFGTGNLKGQANGEKRIIPFDAQEYLLGRSGYIPAGATTTFTLWMRNSGTVGTMFPRAKLYLNNEAGINICTANGTTALTTTWTKYTISCSTASDIAVGASDRLYLWMGVNLTAGSTSKTFGAELGVEGTLNGNYDSYLTTTLPLAPTIYSLTPNTASAGATVTIAGTNFGPLQAGSTVSFNGLPAVITSWSANGIVTTAPASVTTGPVVVTVNGVASNAVTFTVGSGDSDGDGLPDAWEMQYFGNLLQGPNDDPDGDGASNLLEFYQGRNPTKGLVDPSTLINLKVFSPFEP